MNREHRPIDLGEHTGQVVTEAEKPMVATYKISIYCENCEYHGEADIPKGTKVADGECPQCGCGTVVKAKSRDVQEPQSDVMAAATASADRGPRTSPARPLVRHRYSSWWPCYPARSISPGRLLLATVPNPATFGSMSIGQGSPDVRMKGEANMKLAAAQEGYRIVQQGCPLANNASASILADTLDNSSTTRVLPPPNTGYSLRGK